MSDSPDYEVSCGNVFADLGLPDADLLLENAHIILSITQAIKEKGLTQAQAAEILGVQQPRISDLVRGKWEDSSIERLMRFSRLIGNDVQIVINGEAAPHQNELAST